jgi:hypothetical protein
VNEHREEIARLVQRLAGDDETARERLVELTGLDFPSALLLQLLLPLLSGTEPLPDRLRFVTLAVRTLRKTLLESGMGREFQALDAALTRMRDIEPRQALIFEIQFFGRLSDERIADMLHVSPRTVKRDRTMARVWLHGELGGDWPDGPVGVVVRR